MGATGNKYRGSVRTSEGFEPEVLSPDDAVACALRPRNGQPDAVRGRKADRRGDADAARGDLLGIGKVEVVAAEGRLSGLPRS
jgi:hypothetical protein